MPRKHLFFDLDGTLAERCGVIPGELVEKLRELERTADVVIVTGATYEKAVSQLNGYAANYLLSQNGNVWHENGAKTREQLMPALRDLQDVWMHIVDLMCFFNGGHVQHRGSQVSYSAIGHDADPERKKSFDPDMSRRKDVLLRFPFLSEDYSVQVGGTTCFDYVRKDGTKGANVGRFAQMHGWNMEMCTYYGDALEEGGNDHSVVGVCETIPVSSPADTLSKI